MVVFEIWSLQKYKFLEGKFSLWIFHRKFIGKYSKNVEGITWITNLLKYFIVWAFEISSLKKMNRNTGVIVQKKSKTVFRKTTEELQNIFQKSETSPANILNNAYEFHVRTTNFFNHVDNSFQVNCNDIPSCFHQKWKSFVNSSKSLFFFNSKIFYY